MEEGRIRITPTASIVERMVGAKFCLTVEPNEQIIVDGVDLKFTGDLELRVVADAGEIFI